jgi:hypothetical protein
MCRLDDCCGTICVNIPVTRIQRTKACTTHFMPHRLLEWFRHNRGVLEEKLAVLWCVAWARVKGVQVQKLQQKYCSYFTAYI